MTTKPPTCIHETVRWYSAVKGWHESGRLAGEGHWECVNCLAKVEYPAGTGLCPEDVGTNHQVCRKSKA